jgi:hypothetical protein
MKTTYRIPRQKDLKIRRNLLILASINVVLGVIFILIP